MGFTARVPHCVPSLTEEEKIGKLTIPVLKEELQKYGISMSSTKKADLVAMVLKARAGTLVGPGEGGNKRKREETPAPHNSSKAGGKGGGEKRRKRSARRRDNHKLDEQEKGKELTKEELAEQSRKFLAQRLNGKLLYADGVDHTNIVFGVRQRKRTNYKATEQEGGGS